jgi:hypothetical protein
VNLKLEVNAYAHGKASVAKQFPAVVDGNWNNNGFRHLLDEQLQPLNSKFFGGTRAAAGSFRKNNCRSIILIEIIGKSAHFYQSFAPTFAVYKEISAVAQVIGNTWNSVAQFFFAHKLWVVLPKMPDYGRNIVHALVVCHEDTWPICRQVIFILYAEAGAKNIEAAQQKEIKDVNALFVGLISSQVKT